MLFSRAFSTNGQNTIVSLSNPRETLGQRNGLSTIDARQLNKMYKCSGVKPVVTPRPPSGKLSFFFVRLDTLSSLQRVYDGVLHKEKSLSIVLFYSPCLEADLEG